MHRSSSNFRAFASSSVAVGDFDHDGIPDLAAVTPCGWSLLDCDLGFVTLYRGDGKGNFSPTNSVNLNATVSGTAVFVDFYGNGNLDLVVPMLHKGLAIISGNGFSRYWGLNGVTSVQFLDLNHDGKLDMLALKDGALYSFQGDGSGNFSVIGQFVGGGGDLLLGDLNNDGEIDVVASDKYGFSVFLGNGNGNFQAAQRTDGPYTSLAISDFDGDGKLDLVASTWETSNVTVLLGNGDGTFHSFATFMTGQFQSAKVVAGDFNKDGKPDVAVADACWVSGWPCHTDGAVTILLGNGDGTLQIPYSYNAGGRVVLGKYHPHTMFMTSADLDGNGTTDLIVMNQLRSDYRTCRDARCNGTVGILLGNDNGTFQSASLNSHFVSNTSINAGPNPSIYGQPVTLTATVNSAGPVPPTGSVLFKGERMIGEVPLSAGIATLTTRTIAAGVTNISASYSGDNSQLSSQSTPLTLTVRPAPTTTTISSSPNPSLVGKTVTFTITVTSASATPKGTVILATDNGVLATILLGQGTTRYQTKTLLPGSTKLTASYKPAPNPDGGSNFAKSSASIIQIVE